MKLNTRRVLNTIIILLLIGFAWGYNAAPPYGYDAAASPSDEQNVVLPSASSSVLGVEKSGFYLVTKVVDGDTIEVLLDGKKEKVRLIGIDTPETVDPRKSVQCFGKEASAKAKELLLGKNITLESDSTQSERDRYGRLLRYVFLEDRTNINLTLIQEGYAHEYTYQDNPYKYQEEFIQAERDARDGGKGLWGGC